MVKIEINRLNDNFHMEAVNEQGAKVQMDASPDVGGENLGMRPMQMLLAAMGGCSSIDVINILKKQKQPLRDIKVTVTGEREKDVVPAVYTEVHAHFKLYGDLDKDKVARAVNLGVEKYCSVAKTLEANAKITYSIEILP
ncbi:putative redox protein [Chryseolinea serpens]|uniref:Putative redox protein n=1 Tax=Chryseolinea serpens TaxID=947013 RepID=A0A1M5W011_9BACT|nr:OsmC family protein [Chryseolinea serpens]SHH80835.1 putative redox protein [Chryseolinea serpens]